MRLNRARRDSELEDSISFISLNSSQRWQNTSALQTLPSCRDTGKRGCRSQGRLSACFGLMQLKTWLVQLPAPALNLENSPFCLSQTCSAVQKRTWCDTSGKIHEWLTPASELSPQRKPFAELEPLLPPPARRKSKVSSFLFKVGWNILTSIAPLLVISRFLGYFTVTLKKIPSLNIRRKNERGERQGRRINHQHFTGTGPARAVGKYP